MEEKRLILLSSSKTYSQYELADYFHTTPESIMTRIDFLRCEGYVKRVCIPQRCGKQYAGCSINEQTPKNCPVL